MIARIVASTETLRECGVDVDDETISVRSLRVGVQH